MTPQDDPKTSVLILYYISSLCLGGLSALASLLGSQQVLNLRAILSYILAGGLVGLGTVLLLIEKYGPSPFLIGVSIFAGYKAFDVAAVVGVALMDLMKRIFGQVNIHEEEKND